MLSVNRATLRLSRFAAIISCVALTSIATEAAAQSRAALVRDTDNAALQPYTGVLNFNNSSLAANLAAVPAGKRLVVQMVSYAGSSTGALFRAQLGSATSQGFYDRLELGIPNAIAINSNLNWNYITPAVAYFEAGETPSIQMLPTNGYFSGTVIVTGYTVTP